MTAKTGVLIFLSVAIVVVTIPIISGFFVEGNTESELPTPPPPQATLHAIIAEATRTSDHATPAAIDRQILSTAAAIQTQTARVKRASGQGAATPPATPVR